MIIPRPGRRAPSTKKWSVLRSPRGLPGAWPEIWSVLTYSDATLSRRFKWGPLFRKPLRRFCACGAIPFPGLINHWRRPVCGGTCISPAVAQQMRRLFGPCGGVARQDVLAATGVRSSSNDDEFALCIADDKANKQRAKRGGVVEMKRKVGEAKGGGGTPDSANQETRRRNRCHVCHSEHHLFPKCL